MAAIPAEINSFLWKFSQLFYAGINTSLTLNCHDGKLSIGLNADLDPVQQYGYEGQNTSQAFKPSRLRRRQRRREKQKLVVPTQCDQNPSQHCGDIATNELGQDVTRATQPQDISDTTTAVIVPNAEDDFTQISSTTTASTMNETLASQPPRNFSSETTASKLIKPESSKDLTRLIELDADRRMIIERVMEESRTQVEREQEVSFQNFELSLKNALNL